MHIVVYGVGAVGGFYGAMLARGLAAEHQLSFIARGKTLELLKAEGIELVRSAVTDFGEDRHDDLIKLAVNAYASIDELSSPADVVLVCVKSKDTLAVAEALKGKLHKDAYVVSVQNGVENEEKLASVLGASKVIGCLTTVAAENLGPGRYLQKGRSEIIFGELPENKNLNRAEVLKNIMCAAGINAKTTDDIYKSLWTKLVWNTGFNPLSALYELEIGPLISQHQETILALMQETVAVAHAQGIMICGDAASWHFKNTNTQAWASFRTSMMQDALAGKPIELDDILGVLIRRGQKSGVATPVAERVYALCQTKFS